MGVVEFILMITAAIGFANATASRLADVMSSAAGYKVQLHSNVTAHDICMYLATGYQYNQLSADTNITTEAYDDHVQGVAKILTRHVNSKYDDTTEALDTYNKTQKLENFDPAKCDQVTDEEVISWYFPETMDGSYHDHNLERGKRDSARNTRCYAPGQNCKSREGKLDVTLCMVENAPQGISCGCAEYGTSAAACQTSYLRDTAWFTDQHENWGAVTALMIWFRGSWGRNHLRLVGFVNTGQNYS